MGRARRITALFALVAACALPPPADAQGGAVGGVSASAFPRQLVVSALPAADGTQGMRLVTDGASASDCSTGGGAAVVVCVDGGSWAALGSGGEYVETAGDTMTGALALPADGLTVGTSGLVTVGGFVGINTPSPLATLHVTDGIILDHTAIEADDHAFEIDFNAAGFGDAKAVDIVYTSAAISPGDDETVILVTIDDFASTGGDIVGIEIDAVEGDADVYGARFGVTVNPIVQLASEFSHADSALSNATDVLTEFTTSDPGGANNVQVFVSDTDTITLGLAARFEEIEVILEIPASNPGIKPTFEFSTGVGTWSAFSPTDGTNGFRNTGVVEWLDSDIPTWATGTGAEFLIRVTRTRNSLGTAPTEGLIRVASVVVYDWDKEGVISIRAIKLAPQPSPSATCVQGQVEMDNSGALCVCTSQNAWTNVTGVGTC